MKYLTREEAMKHLRVSSMTLWRLTNEKKIPYYQGGEGAKMMFSEEDLDQYMESIKVPAVSAAPAVKSLSGTYRKRRVGV